MTVHKAWNHCNTVANMVRVFDETFWKQKWLQNLILLGPRLLVQVLLLASFLYFFGFPAVARFEKKGVMIVETSKDTRRIPSPAITLAATGQITDQTCFHQNVSMEDCLEKNTLNRSELLKSVVLGFYSKKEINLHQEYFNEDFTSVWAGIYYTLKLPLKIGPNYSEDQLFLGLNSNLTYTVFVHDPEYFLFNLNPIALPTIMRKFTTKTDLPNSRYYRMELTEVNKLNLPSYPCNEDPNYDFQSCLRRSISAKVFSYLTTFTSY